MRLDDKQLHELLGQECPKVRIQARLMQELMGSGSIFVVGKYHTFVCMLRNDYPRWEMVVLS